MGLAQQQKATFAFVATDQRRLAPGGIDRFRLPVPKAGSVGNRLWPPGYIDPPEKQGCRSRTCFAAYGFSGHATQMTATGIARLCGGRDPAGDGLPLMRVSASLKEELYSISIPLGATINIGGAAVTIGILALEIGRAHV